MSEDSGRDVLDRSDLSRFPGLDSTASLISTIPFSPAHSKKCENQEVMSPAATSTRMWANSFKDAHLESSESKVLVIYTGGTIGMIRNDKHGIKNSGSANEKLYTFLIF